MYYLCKLLCGEELRDFYILCAQIVHITSVKLKQTLLELGMYFFQLTLCLRKIAQCAAELGSHAG